VNDSYIEALACFPTALIADCLGRLHVLHHAIRPRSQETSFCGPAFPVEEFEGLNCTVHLAIASIPTGHVLVINAQGYEGRAVLGAHLARAALLRGAKAIVVDGAIRDSSELYHSPIPIFARAVTPAGPLKGDIGKVNEVTSVGGIVVSPGDLVRGDADGIVVVPWDRREQTLKLCEERMKMEEELAAYIEEHHATSLGRRLLAR